MIVLSSLGPSQMVAIMPRYPNVRNAGYCWHFFVAIGRNDVVWTTVQVLRHPRKRDHESILESWTIQDKACSHVLSFVEVWKRWISMSSSLLLVYTVIKWCKQTNIDLSKWMTRRELFCVWTDSAWVTWNVIFLHDWVYPNELLDNDDILAMVSSTPDKTIMIEMELTVLPCILQVWSSKHLLCQRYTYVSEGRPEAVVQWPVLNFWWHGIYAD